MSGDINVQTFSGKVNINNNLLVGTSHLFVDTVNNRVGITTASPGASLEVNGNVHVATDVTFGGTLTGDGSGLTNVNSDSGSWVNGTGNVYLSTTTDKVGIGTSDPTEKIHIKDGSIRLDSTGTVSIINKHDTSDYGVLSLDAGYRGGSSRPKIRIVGYQGQASVNGDNLITFHTNGSERMKINQDGNVGIGTTEPGSTLDVQGTASVPIKKTAPSAVTDTYNYILNAPRPGTTGQGAVHFINGSTRSDDGGTSTYTIRNDSGQLRLGHSSYATLLEGNVLRMSENDNSYFHFGPNSTWGGELFVGATTSKSSSSIKAQCISTDGNLHLDSGTGKAIYLNHYSDTSLYRKGPQYWNGRPMVMVGRSGGQVYATNVFIFDVVGYNDGGMYNSSNGRFTAPWSGYYLFTTTLLGGHQEENCNTRWYINGADTQWGAAHFNMGNGFNFNYTNSRNGLSSQMIYNMNAGSYMQLYIIGGSAYGGSILHTTTTCVYLGGKY